MLWRTRLATQDSTPFPSVEPLVAPCGRANACAIDAAEHRGVCWGRNNHGETDDVPNAALVMVAPGDNRICGIRRKDRRAVCWGKAMDLDVAVPEDMGFQTISVGEQHVCGISNSDNQVVCFGDMHMDRAAARRRISHLSTFGPEALTPAVSETRTVI